MTLQERVRALVELVDEYVEHGSWRCHSVYHPGECHCGLDQALTDAGLDPEPFKRRVQWPEEKPTDG